MKKYNHENLKEDKHVIPQMFEEVNSTKAE